MCKKAAIIGYGKSGIGAEKILQLRGYEQAHRYDDANPECTPIAEYKDRYDITVVSPGIPLSKLPEKPSVYTSEIELSYSWMPMGSVALGVTGTNGKSTVTHFTEQILNGAGCKAVACGNIGYTFADAVTASNEPRVFVVELSSFQIELLRDFSMQGLAFINITPDHLDRYAGMDDYANAKLAALDFVEPEGALIADHDVRIMNRALNKLYRVRYVDKEYKAWPRLDGNRMIFDRFYVDVREFKLFGEHNLFNLVFALSLADVASQMKGDVTHLISDLTGMPHRAEIVPTRDGIRWINDSKATNVDSTLVALKSCHKPTIALLGGRDKKGDFVRLVSELNRCATKVFLFGEAAQLIASQLKNKFERSIEAFSTLRLAVEAAAMSAQNGSTVILSPGCASFDEFLNYEDRGNKFVEYVKEVGNV